MSSAKTLPAALLLVTSSMLPACGAAPYDAHEAHDEGRRTGRQALEDQMVVVVLADPPPEADSGGWEPNTVTDDNPFARTRTWVGDYDCPQGTTDLTFRILAVSGKRVTALFDFHHVESDAAGRYLMAGEYDSETRKVRFTPGEWLVRPPHYVSVGMSGEVSQDGSLFAGRMAHERCGAFRLKPAR